MATRRRLDAELVRRDLARSRQQASELIAAGRDLVPRLIGCLPCLLEADLGIGTDRKLLFDRADPVAESPESAARWGDLDVQSAVVSNLVRLVLWLECSKPSLGQRHVRAFSRCGFRKGPQKARKNVRNPREKAGRSGTIQGPIPLDFCGFNTLFGMFREEQMVPRRGVKILSQAMPRHP